MLSRIALFSGFLYLSVFSLNSVASETPHYRVSVASNLTDIQIEACFKNTIPQRLEADDTAALYIRSMQVKDGGEISVEGHLAATEYLKPDSCVEYRVSLNPRTKGEQRGGPETRYVNADALLTNIGDWLWRPVGPAGPIAFELEFEHSQDVFIGAPWEKSNDFSYLVPATPTQWQGVVTFSSKAPIPIEAPSANLELSILGEFENLTTEQIAEWIGTSANAAATITGSFPVQRAQVVVSAIQRGKGVIPWAYVSRGGGPGIHLFVNESATADQLSRDWSTPHEMLHLLLPNIASGDHWIVEGLPSYYQYIAMARGQVITPENAWSKLIENLVEGERREEEFSVAEATLKAGRRGIYKKIYWGGAAYFFRLDVAIRIASKNQQSLDSVLMQFRDCCFDFKSDYSGEWILEELDRISGTDLFTTERVLQVEQRKFPNYLEPFDLLTIEFLGGHPYSVNPDLSPIRTSIMGKDI